MKTTRNFMGFVAVYAPGVMMTAFALLALAGCDVGVANQCGDNINTSSGGSGGDAGAGGAAGGFPVGGGVPGICQINECDPAGPKDGKLECDDGDPHTADRCIDTKCGGACAHVKVDCDGADPAEVQAAVCDDGNPCTFDRCGVSSCEHLLDGSCDPCIAAACLQAEAECGSVEADCNGDGELEEVACGTCDQPALCVGNTCSDQCLSKYGPECAAEGKATTWAFDLSCEEGSIYKYSEEGEITFCIGCPVISGCQKLDNPLPNGVQVMCCP